MPITYQEQSQLICPACGADIEASVWLILDAQESPEAVEMLMRDELNLVACPHCANTGPAGAPLLFHDGAARQVIFAPAPGSAEHEWRDQARDLHALLVGSIPEEQRRPYLTDVTVAQDLAGIAHLLRRRARRQGDKETGRPGDKETGDPGQPSSTPADASALPNSSEASAVARSTPEQSEQALFAAVEALLAANSPAELDGVLAEHPVLLDPATDTMLAQLADVAAEQRAYEIAEGLRHARALLARIATVLDAPGAASRAQSDDPALVTLPEPALQDLLRAQSAADLEAAATMHPLLLAPEVDRILAERVELALDEGHERLAQALEERREALAQLRAALGGARADGPADETAPLASLDEAIEALLIAEGEAALADVLDRYPVLLEEVAAQALWQFAAEARASGDEELARYAIECRELLRRVREGLGE